MMPKRIDIPPVYFLASGALMVLVHVGLPGPQIVNWPWRRLGLLPTMGGVGLAIAGERAFKRAGTAVLPFSEPSALVTTGPFAFTRNPMYVGLVLCLLGWAVLLGSVVPFAVVPTFFALIHFRFVLREEPFMAERFGEAYAAYRARVRRWL
jgi:protein-S-isoprenylcysteine O-methyltransferase Ste14